MQTVSSARNTRTRQSLPSVASSRFPSSWLVDTWGGAGNGLTWIKNTPKIAFHLGNNALAEIEAGVPGWKTDRGRFYIMYGPPDSIDAKPGLAPPTETWHYIYRRIGQNVVLTFKDECVCGKYQLSGAESDSRIPKMLDPY
jgi:GWxTD domain-containing protein